jgi:hypothetical protein
MEIALEVREHLAKCVAPYSIGFLSFHVENGVENVRLCGSGTLVKIGKAAGILTAAHVLQSLPTSGKIGLLRFDNRAVRNNLRFDADLAEPVLLPGYKISGYRKEAGPDLGFLKIPPDAVGWLNATNSFVDLSVAPEPGLSATRIYAACGAVDEWTSGVAAIESEFNIKKFEGYFRIGEYLKSEPNSFGNELAELIVDQDGDAPKTYRGMSGGGIWRFSHEKLPSGEDHLEKSLVGVVFYESDLVDNNRRLIFHDWPNIYISLLNQLIERWPQDAAISQS